MNNVSAAVEAVIEQHCRELKLPAFLRECPSALRRARDQVVAVRGLRARASRSGDPLPTVIESFWSRIQVELLDPGSEAVADPLGGALLAENQVVAIRLMLQPRSKESMIAIA